MSKKMKHTKKKFVQCGHPIISGGLTDEDARRIVEHELENFSFSNLGDY